MAPGLPPAPRGALASSGPVALGLAARAHAAPLSYPITISALHQRHHTLRGSPALTSSEVRGRGSGGRQAPPVTPHQMHRRSLRDYMHGKAAISYVSLPPPHCTSNQPNQSNQPVQPPAAMRRALRSSSRVASAASSSDDGGGTGSWRVYGAARTCPSAADSVRVSQAARAYRWPPLTSHTRWKFSCPRCGANTRR